MTNTTDFTFTLLHPSYSPSEWHTFGILAPRFWYCCGFFKKLTNSRISSLASSQPATSLNRTLMFSFTSLALDLLMLKGFPRPPPRPPTTGPCRMAKIKNPTMSKVGRTLKRRVLPGKRKRSVNMSIVNTQRSLQYDSSLHL